MRPRLRRDRRRAPGKLAARPAGAAAVCLPDAAPAGRSRQKRPGQRHLGRRSAGRPGGRARRASLAAPAGAGPDPGGRGEALPSGRCLGGPGGGQGGGSPGRVGNGARDPGRAWSAAQITLFTARRGFLPGDDLPWIADVRRELDALYLRALEAYAGASLRVGGTELATAERSARELVARAPFSESGYRVLMEALAQRGNVALSDELGVPPSPATRDLHAHLLRPGAG
jgi:Bacterial transcriptional activator domain